MYQKLIEGGFSPNKAEAVIHVVDSAVQVGTVNHLTQNSVTETFIYVYNRVSKVERRIIYIEIILSIMFCVLTFVAYKVCGV